LLGNVTFKPAQNYDGAYSPDLRNESGITSGDVDGDDDIDIIVGNAASNDVSIYLNKGNGTFNFKMRQPPSDLYGELALIKAPCLMYRQ
jgi:hypothetical protein